MVNVGEKELNHCIPEKWGGEKNQLGEYHFFWETVPYGWGIVRGSFRRGVFPLAK